MLAVLAVSKFFVLVFLNSVCGFALAVQLAAVRFMD
jgi:hypothetical protein